MGLRSRPHLWAANRRPAAGAVSREYSRPRRRNVLEFRRELASNLPALVSGRRQPPAGRPPGRHRCGLARLRQNSTRFFPYVGSHPRQDTVLGAAAGARASRTDVYGATALRSRPRHPTPPPTGCGSLDGSGCSAFCRHPQIIMTAPSPRNPSATTPTKRPATTRVRQLEGSWVTTVCQPSGSLTDYRLPRR